jgi:hypothetical protein
VYAYTATQGAITDVAYLQATHRHQNAKHGSSVALNGDGTILAAGSPQEFVNEIGVDGDGAAGLTAPNSGAVDVLVRQAGANWSAQGPTAPIPHYTKANNTGRDDAFGTAVSLSDDGNTLVVGAPGEDGNGKNFDADNNPGDNSAGNSGAAYLF